MPNLKVLDGQEVTHFEKVKSDILFGADLGQKKENFQSFLPDEEFVDRRLFVAEQIDPESDSEEENDLFEGEIKPNRFSKIHTTNSTTKNLTGSEKKVV